MCNTWFGCMQRSPSPQMNRAVMRDKAAREREDGGRRVRAGLVAAVVRGAVGKGVTCVALWAKASHETRKGMIIAAQYRTVVWFKTT